MSHFTSTRGGGSAVGLRHHGDRGGGFWCVPEGVSHVDLSLRTREGTLGSMVSTSGGMSWM